MWDFFISHASEDKEDIAIPLASELRVRGFQVWLDVSELFLGDSLFAKISEGLGKAKFGIVILSKNFFAKKWTQEELDGLFARQINGSKIILPVWHNIDYEYIQKISPMIAGKLAVSSSKGIENIADQIEKALENSFKEPQFQQKLGIYQISRILTIKQRESIYQFLAPSPQGRNNFDSFVIDNISGSSFPRLLDDGKIEGQTIAAKLFNLIDFLTMIIPEICGFNRNNILFRPDEPKFPMAIPLSVINISENILNGITIQLINIVKKINPHIQIIFDGFTYLARSPSVINDPSELHYRSKCRFFIEGSYIFDSSRNLKYYSRIIFDVYGGEFNLGLYTLAERKQMMQDIGGFDVASFVLALAFYASGKPYNAGEVIEAYTRNFLKDS